MNNSTYFCYDGRWSWEYGLQMVDFDDSTTKEINTTTLSLALSKAPGSVRFFHGGIEYDSAPPREFSVLSEVEIPEEMRREISAWLLGKNSFRPLQFDGEIGDYTYYGVFTSISSIWVNGRCHGFRLSVQFDSRFARGEPTVVRINSGTHTINLYNESDIIDGYTYPIVEFTGGYVSITNTTDDPSREFCFSNVPTTETITVDNETRFIRSLSGISRLGNFNKHWLRLRKGNNTLTVTSGDVVKITCPNYALIGC